MPRVPCIPAIDEMLTIDPPPAARIDGATARMPSRAPIRFTSRTLRTWSRGASSMRPTGITPALLTRIVGGPKASVAVATTAVQRCSSRTSSGSKRAAPPSRAASASPPSASTSVTTTRAPSATNSSASAAPCPRAAPVMSATRPSSRPVTPRSR